MEKKSKLNMIIDIFFVETCLLSNDIYDYHVVSQGKITVPGLDDSEEFEMTHVRKSVHSGFFLIHSFLFCSKHTKSD